MQNSLDHFLSDLANKIQTAKEYKDIIKDSQNVDVNKNVFEGFMLGVAETIKKELKERQPETTQIEAVSSIADQQKNPETQPQEDPLAKFVTTLASTISASKNKPIEQETKDEDEEKKIEDTPVPAPEPQQESFEKFIDNLKDIIQKNPKELPASSLSIVDKKDKPKAGVKDYVKQLDKNPKDENEEKPKSKNDLIKDLVRKFVEGEIKGFKDEISQKFNQVGAAYGGGGGTNAVQYANGGTMDGDLNVSNVYPNNATGSIGSPSNRWDKIYANQVDSLSSNIVIELSGFYVDGDFTVNGTISAIGGNSNQWNSTYTTLNANSGKYESTYTTVNAMSANNASVYTSLNANSGKYQSTYTSLNANSGNYILSGGNITNSSLYIGSNANYNLFLKTNNLPRVVITQAGNVGIGTGEVSNIVLDQSLIGYNFSVLKSSVAATASASLAITSDITANKMERSSGIGAFASNVGWGSQTYTIGATNWQTAIANTEYFTIPIYSETNKTITINSLDSFWVDRSPNGPTNLALLYGTSIIPTLNNVSEITTGVTVSANQWTDTSLQINQALATNPITILPGTSGFIFLVPYGAGTNTGNLRFQSNYPAGNANDLSFRGRITNEPFNRLTVNGTLSAGTISTNAHKTSQDWASNWTTTNTNSASWNGQYNLIASNFNIVAGSYYAVNTTSAIIRGTLPASPTFGDTVTFIDPYYIWGTNNFVLERNGNNIESVTESLSANLDGFTFKATYVGASIGWRIY